MGQTLSEPITEKHTTVVVRGKKYWVGLSDMQGWRISMEDSHSVHLFLPPPGSTITSPNPSKTPIQEQPAGSTVTNDQEDQDGNALICVFDGHGGSSVAKYAGSTIHTRLAALDNYKNGKYEAALKEAFLKTDEDLRADPSFLNDPSGCTAVVGLLTNDGRVIVANSGDSRSVLGWKGEAKPMSYDHKPTNKEETARITSAGGFVEFGRVNGNLALSRALGDFEFKQNFSLQPEKQIVTADPDIITHKLDGEEEFLVLACDGIWDCLSSQQVIDFVRRAVANGDELGKIAENMMTKCLARDSETGGIGCDNMTVVIVALLGDRTPEEWQAWVKERVEKKVGYDTPESIPDVFANLPSSNLGGIGALTGAGFRVAGAGGLANIASILGASNITFKPAADDSDDEDDDHQIEQMKEKSILDETEDKPFLDNKALKSNTKPVDVTDKLDDESTLDSNAKSARVQLVDEDGDSVMDSGDESDETTTGDKPAVGSEPPAPPASSSARTKKGQAPPQLASEPQGDAVPRVAAVEGLMDTSENPLKL